MKFWKSFKDSFSVITGLASLTVAVGFFIYGWGGSQTSQAAEVEKLKEGLKSVTATIQQKSDARDKQFEEIKKDMATKGDIDSLMKIVNLGREESKETRDLLFRVLESRNK